MTDLVPVTYKKLNSFESNIILRRRSSPIKELERAVKILESNIKTKEDHGFSNYFDILGKIQKSFHNQLNIKDSNLLGASSEFTLSDLTAEESALFPDELIPLYLFHRYRYEIFPSEKRIDQFPPYAQIEPSSVCNYRCGFCYQTDNQFSKSNSSYMGIMKFETYKRAIDLLEGKTQFLSLASRGEPLICKDLPKMLEYSENKFLNLKINTNASLLNEENIHSLLSGGATTIVFSIDAPSKSLYEELRVNGKLDIIIKKIKLFKKIRELHYRDNSNIVRVSGVYLDQRQSMKAMVETWGEYVDQITFVKYNPWENVYESPLSCVDEACSELWRRIFIWHDGILNPCDTDYKSKLSLGSINDYSELSSLWRSKPYEQIRRIHLDGKRSEKYPCNKCVLI